MNQIHQIQKKLCETKENVYKPSGSDISYVGVSGNMDPELASISTDRSDYAEVSGLDTFNKDTASTAKDALYSEKEMTIYRGQDSYHIQLDDRPCSVCRSDIDDSVFVAVKGGALQENRESASKQKET
ncbi:hypothetical protein CHS0354_040458 [Potamilus streckersoni]|uniref:Uncharacterized protein n=1 Tax=Potamilus streckersoni TaxID=2493646 RepID=A0AAE0T0H7_9BIVA|nr:hypothetical protein CHS0354_040458 [Potamilus streckersoni]